MQLNREGNTAKYQITAYSDKSISINGTAYAHGLIVMPNQFCAWPVASVHDLVSADLAALLEFKPEVILLGTGAELVFPALSITQAIFSQRIGLEIMTTAAACRTYSALSADGRNVMAALLLG